MLAFPPSPTPGDDDEGLFDNQFLIIVIGVTVGILLLLVIIVVLVFWYVCICVLCVCVVCVLCVYVHVCVCVSIYSWIVKIARVCFVKFLTYVDETCMVSLIPRLVCVYQPHTPLAADSILSDVYVCVCVCVWFVIYIYNFVYSLAYRKHRKRVQKFVENDNVTIRNVAYIHSKPWR